MNVSIIGLGYIGLPTAALLATKGVEVLGVDINHNVVDMINEGKSPIVEAGLESILSEVVKEGLLFAYSEPQHADVFIIAVPTPFKEGKKPDISFIESATKSIAPFLRPGNLIILESTVPVGTTKKIRDWLIELRKDLGFLNSDHDLSNQNIFIAHCPERVLPGNIINELVTNNRTIGGLTPSCSQKAKDFYEIFVEGDCVITDSKTAELSKLVENSFRDVNIAFANELSVISDKLDIDVWEVVKLANLHPRVNILEPGPGVGGHCISVDPWFIIDSAPEEALLIKSARIVNDSKPKFVLRKVHESIKRSGKDISKLSITCLGLAFKKDIDDLRESPAMGIAYELAKLNFKELTIVEPNIVQKPNVFKNLEINFSNSVDCIERSDIILLLVDHTEFKEIHFKSLEGKEIIDTRGLWLKK